LLCALIATTALVACGRRANAEAHLSEALTLVRDTGESWCEAELHRLHGEMLQTSQPLRRRDSKRRQDLGAEAEASLRRALEVARRQGAKWWELRAAVSLARLLSQGERAAEGREILRRVSDELGEGFDLPDLRAARELLQSL